MGSLRLREKTVKALLGRLSTVVCREKIFEEIGDSGDRISGTIEEMDKLRAELDKRGVSRIKTMNAEMDGRFEAHEFISELEEAEELAVNETLI